MHKACAMRSSSPDKGAMRAVPLPAAMVFNQHLGIAPMPRNGPAQPTAAGAPWARHNDASANRMLSQHLPQLAVRWRFESPQRVTAPIAHRRISLRRVRDKLLAARNCSRMARSWSWPLKTKTCWGAALSIKIHFLFSIGMQTFNPKR